MISWLQINLQKHFRVVFIILLVVLVVAFVFTIGNQGPLSGRDERTANLYFFDTPLTTESARLQFQQDANLSATLSGNMRPSSSLPFERATALHIANQHGIPEPSQEQLRSFIESRRIFQGANGSFDAQAYNMIIDSLSLGGRTTEADIHRVLVDDYRIEKVFDVLAGNGFVQESEILESLSQRLAKWSVLVAKADLNAYSPELEITEEMLEQHYKDFSFTYQTPARRVVDYIEIDARDFVDEIKPSEDELITYFEANIDRYQPEPEETAEGEEPAAPVDVTFEEARLAVREDLRLEQARELALEKAHDLVVEIVENEYGKDSPALADKIKALDLKVQTTSAFASNEAPIGPVWNREAVSQAFELTEDRFYSEPIQIGNKAVVIFYNNEIPPVVPDFNTLRERVANDVRQELLRKERASHVVELQGILEAATESEETFGAAAEEAGLDVQSFSDFTLTEPAEGLDNRLLSAIVQLSEKGVSDFVKTGGDNTGAFVYAISKEVPEVSADDPQYAQVKGSLEAMYAQASAQQYVRRLMLEEQMRIGLVAEPN